VPLTKLDVYFRDTGVAVKDGRVVALLPIDELTAKYTYVFACLLACLSS